MSYVESNLTPGETLVYETRLHWIVMLGHIVVAVLLVIGGAVLLYYALNAIRLSIQAPCTRWKAAAR